MRVIGSSSVLDTSFFLRAGIEDGATRFSTELVDRKVHSPAMLGRREWRVRTPFSEINVRIVGISDASPEEQRSSEHLLAVLCFELRNYNPEVLDALNEAHHSLRGFGRPPTMPRQPSQLARHTQEIERALCDAVRSGHLEIAEVQRPKIPQRLRSAVSARPVLGPEPEQVEEAGHFEVRFVDETGQAIDGIDVVFSGGGKKDTQKTDGNGVARFEGTGSFASVGPSSIDAVRSKLEPRWATFRPPNIPSGPNITEQVFSDALESISLQTGQPATVVLKPAFGKIQMQLFDKTGQVQHSNRSYSISGPIELSGVTDVDGALLHDDIPPGDYKLSLTVDDDEKLEAAVVARSADRSSPQVRFLGVAPRVRLARLKGLFFETNKSFLLPATMSVFDRFRDVYLENNPAELLIVGHTDTTAEPAINDPLSLERANNTAAFVLDDVDAWLKMYETSVPSGRRWSANEDELMMLALPDSDTKPANEAPLHWFQRTRGLQVDGVAGPKTRRQLVSEYMALDDASLKDPEFDIKITTHGCGENFPLDASGEELDSAPADGAEDQTDRRVEFFFFDAEFGIQPPPPGDNSPKGSTQYPEWRRKAELSQDVDASGAVLQVLLQDPDGQPLPNTRVQLLQDGVVVRTRTSDDSGIVSITGHDASRPCELVVIGQSPLVIDGGRDDDPDLALEQEDQSRTDALDGCQVELADAAPFEPPDLDGASVLV